MDEDSWENTSVQSSKDDGDEINKETQINLGGRPKGDIWQHFNEINNGKKSIREQFVIFVIYHYVIIPYNASYKKIFSVLNWYLCKRRTK